MSEEKLYIVKNDEGKYLYFSNSAFWGPDISDCLITPSKKQAGLFAFVNGGHVVTFVEEPEKVVLTKEQAEIVKEANKCSFPANHITLHASSSDEEKLVMEAYVNGYTIKKEPVSLVYVPGTNKDFVYCKRGKWSKKGANPETPVTPQPIATWHACEDKDVSLFEFTDAEITKFGLQDCEKEEVK